MVPADAEPRRSLLLRGVLDMCVLAMVREQPDHVYGLVGRLTDRGLGKISFGSLYPLVTRLRQQGLVIDTSEQSPVGPPRTVISLSNEGEATLERWTEQWQAVNVAVAQLLHPERHEPTPKPTQTQEA